MTSKSRAIKLVTAASDQCSGMIVSRRENSKILSHSKCFNDENSESVHLTNILFDEIMKDKVSKASNTDFKNDTVVLDTGTYEEIFVGINNVNSCLTNSNLTEVSSEISRASEDWIPQSAINQNNLNLSVSNCSENNSSIKDEENINIIISAGPSRQLFEMGDVLEEMETCDSTSSIILGVECLEDRENQLEEIGVIGEESRKKKKKENIRVTKQLKYLNGVVDTP